MKKMYKNKIALSLKHKNIPLVEEKETFFIPFNTEYSIYLKNMSTEIALISVFVNGRDVSPGEKIRILPKCSATIEKFKDTDHRFVFKEKTKAFQEARLSNDEDGLIRLEVDFDLSAKINPFEINFNNCNSKAMTNKADNSTLLTPNTNGFQDMLDNSAKDINIPGPGISTMDDIHTQLYKSSGNSLFNESMTNSSIYQNTEIKEGGSAFTDRSVSRKSISNPILDNVLDDFVDGLIQDTASLNAGITMPGRIKKDDDDIKYVKDKYGSLKAVNYFEFIVQLKEATKSIVESKKKKNCPSCEKKFKYKYFFCPYDGTFLND